MDTMPDDDPMKNPAQTPLGGLDPADLLRQGVAEDTFAGAGDFQPPSLEEMGSLFPRFEMLELIGKGGMGAVYKVRQKDLDRIVALKILPPAIGQAPAFSSRFTREARALAKLNHPGIVTIHEFGQRDGLYFILMEFVDGVSLARLMKTGRVSPREALAIVPQICDALQFAHDQGIVHRDIKPENILLDRHGRVKVADFGIAKLIDADDPSSAASSAGDPMLTEAGKVMGTPQYMAPEQIEHPSEVDHRADIYALGVVFYQMLTGELPGKDLQAPSKKVHIDVRLDEVVLRALEKKPELRYQQASLLKTQVETIASGSGHKFTQFDSGQSEVERPAYNPWETTSIAAGSILFVVMFMFALESTQPFRVPLIAMSVLGMGICVLSIAGFWPFPSPLFPEPNFSSRNLRRNKTNASPSDPSQIESATPRSSARSEPLTPLAWLIFSLAVMAFLPGSLLDRVVFGVSFFGAGLLVIRWIGKRRQMASNRTSAPPGGEPAPTESSTPARKRDGKPRTMTWMLIGSAILVVAMTALFFSMQRPRLQDETTISSDSPDGMHSALVQTWHAMRVFDDDHTFYKFVVQGRGGAVFETWELPVPYGELAANHVLLSPDEVSFAKHGHIVWSDDSKRVSFQVKDVEVSAFNTADGSHSFQGGYLPQQDVEVRASPNSRLSFLNFDTGQIVTPSEKTIRAWDASSANGQMDSDLCEWMRSTGADLRIHAGIPDLTLLDGASIAMAETSGPNANPRAFDTMPAAKVIDAVTAVEQTLAGGPHPDPPLFGLHPNRVAAVKTREGAVALVELLENPKSGTPRLRYKLVQNGNLPTETAGKTLADQPPVVVETFPASGTRDVPPGEAEIRVRFSKEMADSSWSWSTAWEDSAPEIIGQPHYEADGRTCVVKVKLEPSRSYAFWLNSEKFANFRDINGRPAVSYLLIFQTKPN
jgi:serine/threonine protein kinase